MAPQATLTAFEKLTFTGTLEELKDLLGRPRAPSEFDPSVKSYPDSDKDNQQFMKAVCAYPQLIDRITCENFERTGEGQSPFCASVAATPPPQE